jgi:hypothetical protein
MRGVERYIALAAAGGTDGRAESGHWDAESLPECEEF